MTGQTTDAPTTTSTTSTTTHTPIDACYPVNPIPENHTQHRELIALGVISGDLAPRAISRHGEVPLAHAIRALKWGAANDIIVNGTVADDMATALLAELGPTWVADAHTRIARRLFVDGWEHVNEVVHHARAAGALGPVPDLIAGMERAAMAALSISDYAAARALLEAADELSTTEEVSRRSWRLCRLAEALDGLGYVEQARDAAALAFDLAEIAGDAALGLKAAVMSAFPSDWHAGDLRTSAIIRRAEDMDQSEQARVALLGARALAEMRIPLGVCGHQQVAWVTRASVAQPLANEAVRRSTGSDTWERLVALLAWRSCHRSSRHLEERLTMSLEALDISQRMRLPSHQVEAAIMLCADAIESADRTLFDHTLSVARWVAQRDGNPRLLAHTRAMEAGVAFAEGDIELAQRLHFEAVELADSVNLSSRGSLNFVLLAQYHVVSGEHPPRELIPRRDHPILAHPLAQTATALAWARLGEKDEAEALVRRTLRRVDEESSMLLTLVVAAEAVVQIGSDDLCDHLISLLTPWSEHVAIDSNTWWHGGPVAAALAELSAARGDHAAVRYAQEAEQIASAIGDSRTLRRMERVRASENVPHLAQSCGTATLSARQTQILTLVAAGLTNPEIATQLSYSRSTVKAEIAGMLRNLGLTNRAQAARYATEHRLITDLDSTSRD
jgi:DNA-binding CsgD family transcriptional regulator